MGWAAAPVSAATLTVCPSGCQYTQISTAAAAARDGDTIRVGPGRYRGGVRIEASLRLAGAGPRSTVIAGGGHVVTVGAIGAAREPVVSISGVRITGGVARSSPVSAPFTGRGGVLAGGGGVEIPPQAISAEGVPSGGATVVISGSVIDGNRADPAHTVPSGLPCAARCPFALAAGGGIESWGRSSPR
ncbi:MAG TPA: hypothetical protein VGM53_09810 [Streptosporangiaceae bacterium]